jgi:hypothetical protein
MYLIDVSYHWLLLAIYEKIISQPKESHCHTAEVLKNGVDGVSL